MNHGAPDASAHSVSWRRLAAAVAVAMIAAAVVFATARPPDQGPEDGRVTDEADRAQERRMTVAGRVHEVVSAKSFTVTRGDDTMLVVGVPALPALDDDLDGILKGEEVRVSGVAKTFVLEEIERHVGELIDRRYERFAGKPVIVADSVTPLTPR